MRRMFRRRPSPAMVVALIALTVALGGSSYAAMTIRGSDLRTSAVGTRAILNNSVRSADVRNNNITGRDVRDNTLNNSDIDNNTLQAQSANTAEAANTANSANTANTANSANTANAANTANTANTANSATTANSAQRADRADDAGTLDGLDSLAFTRPACTSQSGAVKGFAHIAASAGFSTTFTTTGVNFPYNCSGGTVEARRLGTGMYEVRFNGAAPSVAVVSPMEEGVPVLVSTSVGRSSPGVFRVSVVNTLDATSINAPFALALF